MIGFGIALAVVGALLAQTAFMRMAASAGAPVDLVLVVVVLAALARGPLAGLWAGAGAGLLEDMLSGGVVGINGFARSSTGALVGTVGSRFVIGTVWQRFVVIVLASVFHAVCLLSVHALVGAAPAVTAAFVLRRAAADGMIGVAALVLASAASSAVKRSRRRRAPFAGRRWSTS